MNLMICAGRLWGSQVVGLLLLYYIQENINARLPRTNVEARRWIRGFTQRLINGGFEHVLEFGISSYSFKKTPGFYAVIKPEVEKPTYP